MKEIRFLEEIGFFLRLKPNEVTNMATDNEFKTFYEFHLKPKLVALEKQRNSVISSRRTILVIYGVLMVVAILAMWRIFITPVECESGFSVAVTIFGMILLTWETSVLYRKQKSVYRQNFKHAIIRPIVSFIDEELNYDPDKKASLDAFHTSQLFKHKYGERVEGWAGEDYVEGTFSQTPMTFSEVKALDVRGSGDSTYYVTIFRGLFFEFNFNFKFEGVTLVVPYYKPNIVGLGKLWAFGNKKTRAQIPLDDPELAQNFTIYSDNPTMARQVITTDFLRRLLIFRRRIKKPVFLSFVDGKLYLAIRFFNKDLFEVPLSHSVLNFGLIETFFEYLRLGTDIVKMVKEASAQLNAPFLPKDSLLRKGDDKDQLETHKTSSPNQDAFSVQPAANLTPSEQFRAFYKTYLIPKLLTFEKQRQAIARWKTKRKILVFSTVSFFILYIVLPLIILPFLNSEKAMANFMSIWMISYFLFIIIIVVVGTSFSPSHEARELFQEMEVLPYKANFKSDIIGSIVTFVDNQLGFGPETQIPISEFQASGLVKRGQISQWGGEDYVQGTLANTKVRFVEVHTLAPKKSDKTSKGLFFIFNFQLDFEGVTVVLPKTKLGLLSRLFGKKSLTWGGTELNLVKLADSEFEREFVVYSNNPAMIDDIFSAGLKQRLLAFRRRLDKNLSLSVVNGKLYMAIETQKDLFEAPINETVLNFELLHEFFEYLYLGKQIVEALTGRQVSKN
jgi:hypothetical protein